jgi:hypothetical protein
LTHCRNDPIPHAVVLDEAENMVNSKKVFDPLWKIPETAADRFKVKDCDFKISETIIWYTPST